MKKNALLAITLVGVSALSSCSTASKPLMKAKGKEVSAEAFENSFIKFSDEELPELHDGILKNGCLEKDNLEDFTIKSYSYIEYNYADNAKFTKNKTQSKEEINSKFMYSKVFNSATEIEKRVSIEKDPTTTVEETKKLKRHYMDQPGGVEILDFYTKRSLQKKEYSIEQCMSDTTKEAVSMVSMLGFVISMGCNLHSFSNASKDDGDFSFYENKGTYTIFGETEGKKSDLPITGEFVGGTSKATIQLSFKENEISFTSTAELSDYHYKVNEKDKYASAKEYASYSLKLKTAFFIPASTNMGYEDVTSF